MFGSKSIDILAKKYGLTRVIIMLAHAIALYNNLVPVLSINHLEHFLK